MKIAALFPGQGSQSVGMGVEFSRTSEVAQELFRAADKALGFELSKLCFEGPIEELTLTQNAQPAILVTSYIAFTLSGITNISAAAGHSLGEYSALAAAGSIDFVDAVVLVHKRGKYMQEAVEPGAGKMVAVMGPDEAEIRDIIVGCNEGVAAIANLNCPGQTVVAGDVLGVDSFSARMSEKGAKLIPLNVSAPFHCPLMEPAARKLAADLDAMTLLDPSFPVYANVSAKPIQSGDEARELLKEQVCAPVRWTDSMVNMIEQHGITHAVEFGAGGVLSKLLKRIDKTVTRHEVSSPESLSKTTVTMA